MEITEAMVDRAAAAIRSEMLNNGWMITGITQPRLNKCVREAALCEVAVTIGQEKS